MKKSLIIGIVLILLLLGGAGCSPSSKSSQRIPASIDLTAQGSVSASVEESSVQQAFDGDMETMWVALHHAPTWVAIEFDELNTVTRIELTISQHEPGPSTHEIWFEDESYTTTFAKRLANVPTEDRHTLDVIVDPPIETNRIYILTTQSHGWVSWREIRVWGFSGEAEPRLEKAGWRLEPVASGLELPVQVTHAGDGSGRMFVAERPGRIRIIRDGTVDQMPFLDISNRVYQDFGVEEGFYNIAFPPAYAELRGGEGTTSTHRQHFYVSYTNVDGDTVISRFATTGDPGRADPDSEEILLVLEQPHVGHNGGTIVFGPDDGYLYIGSGDGGDTIPRVLAQEPGILLGKILRIDVEADARPYGIPPDNPFVQTPGYRPEVWVQGVRNPWGFAFDPQTGDLFISDVGQSSRDEVNFRSAGSAGGEHYGWPIWEGNYCHEVLSVNCATDGFVLPVTNYDHSQGCAIVGGAVRDGVFFYADFCRGRIWALQRQGERWKNELLIDGSVPISSIGSDEEGNIYAVGHHDGVIYALIPPTEEHE